MSDRAVSDVLGFVLIFSLIALTVGTVTIVGFGGLQNARDFERVNNAERAFDVLADNFEDIQHHDAPARSTELKLADATLSSGDSTTLRATAKNSTSTISRFSVDTDPIVYSADTGARIVYEAGAVIREDEEGAVMLHEPDMTFRKADGETTVVAPFVQTRLQRGSSLGGSTTLLVRGELVITEVLVDDLDGDGTPDTDADKNSYAEDVDSSNGDKEYDVVLSVATTEKRAPVWDKYLDARLEPMTDDPDTCTVTGGLVECQFYADHLYVTAIRIDVNFEQ